MTSSPARLASTALLAAIVAAATAFVAHAATTPPAPHDGAAATQVVVSPFGNDTSGDGSVAHPFRTLQRAAEAARVSRQAPSHRVTGTTADAATEVLVRSGRYPQHGLQPLTLQGPQDSDVAWRVHPGDTAPAVVTGGMLIGGPWTPVAASPALPPGAAGNVFKTSLAAAGVTLSQLGNISSGTAMHARVTVGGAPTHLARWPNADAAGVGNWTWVHGVKSPTTIGFNASRPLRWTNATQAMLHGYFKFFWRDTYCAVSDVDATAKTISCSTPIGGDTGLFDNAAYYVFNLLEELDADGEVYIDRDSASLDLYVFRADGTAPAAGEVELSLATQPLVSMAGVSNVSWSGIAFTMAQSVGVSITDGHNVTMSACNVTHMGEAGVTITNGTQHSFSGGAVRHTGSQSIVVTGGDRPSLTPALHVVEDSDLGFFGQWIYTYNPGVAVSGVGVTVRRNALHDAAHAAVLVSGNDHTVSNNAFHNVVLQGYDSGAIYSDRDWTYRGNTIVDNLFLDIGATVTPCNAQTSCIRMGIYVDDHASGFDVRRNVFVNMQTGVFSHEGRDHTLTNNLFIDVGLPVRLSGTLRMGSDNATLYQRLAAVPYTDALWAGRYPRLASLLHQHPAWPEGNNLTANVAVNTTGPSPWEAAHGWNVTTQEWCSLDSQFTAGNWTVGANMATHNPGFLSDRPVASLDFELAPSSPAFDMGWVQLPTTFGPPGWRPHQQQRQGQHQQLQKRW